MSSSPPWSFYSRKPILVLPDVEPEKDAEGRLQHEDPLDRYVDDVLKRPSRFKRTMQGIWSFLKTRVCASLDVVGSPLTLDLRSC
jgi:hypothetical protein